MDDGSPFSLRESTVVASEKEVTSGFFAGIARSSVVVLGAFLRQSIPGTLSGLAEDTSSYPFDLVKTRMQVALGKGSESSATYVIKDTIQKHGVKGLFRGFSLPLVTGGLVNGFLFGTYGSVAEMLHEGGINNLDLRSVWFCGLAGGIVQSFIACPVELIKCKMQVSHGSAHISSLHLLRTTPFPSLYRGITSTILKDGPGYGFFFATYEYIKRQQKQKYIEENGITELPRLVESTHVLLAGGTAGMVYGVLTHPIDVIKSTMQTDSSFKNTWECTKHIYRNGGWRAFFSGITLVALRSFPAQAIGFLVYELSLKMWS